MISILTIYSHIANRHVNVNISFQCDYKVEVFSIKRCLPFIYLNLAEIEYHNLSLKEAKRVKI